MLDKLFRNAINRGAENDVDRRRFLRSAGVAGIGVAGAGLLTAGTASATSYNAAAAPSDGAV